MTDILITSSANGLTLNDLLFLDFDSATLTSQSSSQITAIAGGYRVTLTGTFYYDSYGLTLNSVFNGFSIHSPANVLLGQATGFSLTGSDIYYGTEQSLLREFLGGNDTYTSFWNGPDIIDTGAGNDMIRTGTGNDSVTGGSGFDTFVLPTTSIGASFATAGTFVEIQSAYGRDTVTGIELLRFNDRDIALHQGNNLSQTLTGDRPGSAVFDDLMMGFGGNDKIIAGLGNDIVLGGYGNDTVYAGAGNDLVFGDTGADKLLGKGGADRLQGGAQNDVAYGGAGADRVNGGAGDDRLFGGGGADVIRGDAGADRLIGQKGDDVLTGGGGRDTFVINKGQGADRITDFTIGTDVIEIARGAGSIGQLTFARQGADVLVSFADASVLVEDVTRAALMDADNFLFT